MKASTRDLGAFISITFFIVFALITAGIKDEVDMFAFPVCIIPLITLVSILFSVFFLTRKNVA